MAKRKKGKKKSAARRVGAMALSANSPLVLYGSIAAGYLLGDKINEALDKVIPPDKVDAKLVGAGEAGLGLLLIMQKKKKHFLITAAGGLMAGAGAKRLMKSFGIGGYQMVPGVAGYQNVPAVGRRSRLNGYNPGNGGMGWNTRLDTAASSGYMGGRR